MFIFCSYCRQRNAARWKLPVTAGIPGLAAELISAIDLLDADFIERHREPDHVHLLMLEVSELALPAPARNTKRNQRTLPPGDFLVANMLRGGARLSAAFNHRQMRPLTTEAAFAGGLAVLPSLRFKAAREVS